jgi:ubiquitin-conjugating enzyme E2 variant
MSLFSILLAVLLADFLTGLFHWVEECYGRPSWPWIGKSVILPNIDHHLRPQAFTEGTFFSRNWQPFAFAAAVAVLATLLFGVSPFLLLVCALAALGNEVHVWNHRPAIDNPPFVHFLHDAGLIQCRKQHGKHHMAPYVGYYCTLINFNNAWLERIGFWSWLEDVILVFFDIAPQRGSDERSGV